MGMRYCASQRVTWVQGRKATTLAHRVNVAQGQCIHSNNNHTDDVMRNSAHFSRSYCVVGTLRDRRTVCRGMSVVASSSSQGLVQETRAVLFDMDGVLCNSEVVSRKAGAETMKVLYDIDVSPDEFIPYTGTGEANFLGGVARKFNVENFDVETCKAMFFDIYLTKYAVPGSGIGYEGALELVQACRDAGLATAVASSADLVKVHANLSAADIPLDLFDAIVSADAFENLKPSPDIFLAASAKLGIPPANCVVIEDAVAGVTAARAADMRCIGVTTTLSEDDMVNSAPDKIAATIQDISLETILTLQDTRDFHIDEKAVGLAIEGVGGGYAMNDEVLLLSKILAIFWGLATTVYFLLSSSDFDAHSMLVYRRIVVPWSIQGGLFCFLFIGFPYWKKSIFQYSSPSSLKLLVSQDVSYKRLDTFPWIHSQKPMNLSDDDLNDTIVILKFWTSGCINCQNTQHRIQTLQSKYGSSKLIIIGIHSGKFERENDAMFVQESMQQLNITYPVVVDSEEHELFKQFGVTGWPTFVAVKPLSIDARKDKARARILSTFIGEGSLNDLEKFLEENLPGSADVNLPYRANSTRSESDGYMVKAPSYVDFDSLTGRIFLSDTGNNRVLVLNSSGQCLYTFGGTEAGYKDGNSPKFRCPRGLVYDSSSDCIFVCDTGNHSIRCINMGTQIVSTLCGNGNQGFDLIGGKAGMEQRLNSPYGIVMAPGGDHVFVSMAGIHQLWSINIKTQVALSFSGIGIELNRNGGLDGNGLSTAYSQPQGLALQSANMLVVTDSESSSIRLVNIETGGSTSLIGGDIWFESNLFLYGDRDGSSKFSPFPLFRPLLEHPSDVAVSPTNDQHVFISDTYNNKIKLYDFEKSELHTVSDAFEAPEGICFMDSSHLLVVDRLSLKILDIDDGHVSNVFVNFQQTDYPTDICKAR